ncbi:MAG: sugar phosphate isomerase/epimerase [Rubricoccaceae bacterium]
MSISQPPDRLRQGRAEPRAMSAAPLHDYSRLCIHTMTTKPWAVDEAAARYAEAGLGGITVWRNSYNGLTPRQVGESVRVEGLELVSLVRGGFFPAADPAGQRDAIDDNKRIIDEAAEMGAPLVVLVPGALPEQSLQSSRSQIHDGLAAVLPYAEAAGVKLGIEPLHPMYADNRSAVNTLGHANDIAEAFDSAFLGVVVDVYHLWWDPNLEREIARCGAGGNLLAYHVCDWRTPTEDLLVDRGLMGEGCIPLRQIRGWVEEAGFDGYIEVEIFSERYWDMDQSDYLKHIQDATLAHV